MQVSSTPNVLVVQVTPAKSDRLPTTPREVVKRIEQIHFNATLNAAIEVLHVGMSRGASPKLRRLHIDRISAQDEFEGLADENVRHPTSAIVSIIPLVDTIAMQIHVVQAVPVGWIPGV